MPFGVPDTRQFPWDQALSNNLKQLSNGVTGGINTWAQNPTVGVDGLALGVNHVGYTGVNTTSNTMVRWSGTAWVSLMDTMKVARADISFFLHSASGLDTNSGLSVSEPLKTSTKLRQVMAQYLFLDVNITINLGPGEYSLDFLNISERDINVIGAGSSQTMLTSLNVTEHRVAIKNLTLYNKVAGGNVAVISRDSELHIGPDIVMDGTADAYYFVASNGLVHLYPNCPLKITRNCFSPLYVQRTYGGIVFRNNSTIATGYKAPPKVIPVSTSADISCSLQFIGNIAVTSVFSITQGASMWGDASKGTCNVTGAVTGLAYRVILNTKEVYINTKIGTASADSNTIAYPTSISAGIIDSNSAINGTIGI